MVSPSLHHHEPQARLKSSSRKRCGMGLKRVAQRSPFLPHPSVRPSLIIAVLSWMGGLKPFPKVFVPPPEYSTPDVGELETKADKKRGLALRGGRGDIEAVSLRSDSSHKPNPRPEGLGQYSFIFYYIGLLGVFSDLGMGFYFMREVARDNQSLESCCPMSLGSR